MTQVDQPCILQLQLFLWGKKFHPMLNAKTHAVDNSCRTFRKGSFHCNHLWLISQYVFFCLSATKKLSPSAIGAAQMKGVPLVEKYQWHNSWWQTSQKLKVPNCVVGFVFYRHQCIYCCLLPIVTEWKYPSLAPTGCSNSVTLFLHFNCYCMLWNSCLGYRGLL